MIQCAAAPAAELLKVAKEWMLLQQRQVVQGAAAHKGEDGLGPLDATQEAPKRRRLGGVSCAWAHSLFYSRCKS